MPCWANRVPGLRGGLFAVIGRLEVASTEAMRRCAPNETYHSEGYSSGSGAKAKGAALLSTITERATTWAGAMRVAGVATGLIAQTIGAAGTIIAGSVIACSSSNHVRCQVNDLRFHIVHAVSFYADSCLPTSSSTLLNWEYDTVKEHKVLSDPHGAKCQLGISL